MAAAKSSETEVRRKLTRIKALKSRFDAVDAEIGKLVPRIEAMLDSLRLGTPIRIEMEEGPNGHPTYLAFTKVAKQWRLCVERTTDDLGTDLETRPLADVSRDERAHIFDEYLHTILDHAVEEVERRIRSREGSVTVTAEMVAAVEKVLKAEHDPTIALAATTDDQRLPPALEKVARVALALTTPSTGEP
jgi:hypothetical protein